MTAAEAKARREALGLSQGSMSLALEVHPPFGGARSFAIHPETISRYERGRYPVPDWYGDVLVYLDEQGLEDDEELVVTFPTVITKRYKKPVESVA